MYVAIRKQKNWIFNHLYRCKYSFIVYKISKCYIVFMFLSLRNTRPVDKTRFLLKQATKPQNRMRIKIVIYVLNDELVMQKQ